MFNSSAAYPNYYQIEDFTELPLTVLEHFEWSCDNNYQGSHSLLIHLQYTYIQKTRLKKNS
jgi:hypothetical protein